MKFISLLAMSAVLVSCSHYSPKAPAKTPAHPMPMASNWMQMIKHHGTVAPRTPASASKINFDELAKALNKYNGWRSIPVGHEVVRTDVSLVEGKEEKNTQTTVYLKQTKYGHIMLQNYSGDAEFTLIATETESTFQTTAEIIAELKNSKELKNIKKLSDSVFLTTYNIADDQNGAATCDITMDLKNHSDSYINVCRDSAGKATSESKQTSDRKVNLSDYETYLKETQINVEAKILENAEQDDVVRDEQKRDWTYLIK